MLVVSNIDLTIDLPTMSPSQFLESSVKDSILNINNDYRYLKVGYYVSLHAEILGNPVIPPSENIIDAYRTPIFLLRALKAGIPTVPYLVTDSVKQMISEFSFPMVVFAVNPFVYDGYKIAKSRSGLYKVVKSLGINYKFDVCVEPYRGEVVSFKSIFGKCGFGGCIEEISRKVYEVFKIPFCKLYIQNVEGKAYLCGLQPVKKEEIVPADLAVISREVSQIFKDGKFPVG